MVEAETTEANPTKSGKEVLEDDDNQWTEYFDAAEMESYIKAGLCECIETEQRIGIHPYWFRDPEQGAMEELRRNLGRLCNEYQGYLLGLKMPKLVSRKGKQNHFPNPLAYFTFKVTKYIYRPAVGQTLKGPIVQIGKNAAVCTVFGMFTATIYPQNDNEFGLWTLHQEKTFIVTSFDQLRKGVILRGSSVDEPGDGSVSIDSASVVIESRQVIRIASAESIFAAESLSPPKSKRKRFDSVEADEATSVTPEKPPKKKRKKKDKEAE